MAATPELSSPLSSKPSLAALFVAFAKISLLSFGGGISALMYRDFVVSKRWISEADFISGLSLSQAMPGVNVTNLAIWLGYNLRGPAGAIVACLGALGPPAFLIIAMGAVLHRLGEVPVVTVILAGIAAAALGLSLSMGIRTARFALRDPICVVIFGLALGGAILHGSVILIIEILAPISILFAYRQLRDE